MSNEIFKNQNDYSIILYENKTFLCKYTYVGNVKTFLENFANKNPKFKNWTSCNVYARRSGDFIVQYKPNSIILPKPKF